MEIIAGSLQERVYFTRLLAILSTVLEQNANYDAVHQFKHLLLIRLARTGALLEHALDFLQPGKGAHLLLDTGRLRVAAGLCQPDLAVRCGVQPAGEYSFLV